MRTDRRSVALSSDIAMELRYTFLCRTVANRANRKKLLLKRFNALYNRISGLSAFIEH